MPNENYMLVAAGFVWLIFIAVGIIGRPVKMTPVVSVGGSFLAAVVTLAIVISITKFFLKNGVENGILIILFFLLLVGNAVVGIFRYPIIYILASTLIQFIIILIFLDFNKNYIFLNSRFSHGAPRPVLPASGLPAV